MKQITDVLTDTEAPLRWREDITVEEYHEHLAVSSGGVRCLISEGPLEFWWCYIARRKDREETVAKRMGRIFHFAMEKPDEWEDKFFVPPTRFQDDGVFEHVVKDLEGTSAAVPQIGDELNNRAKATKLYLAGWERIARSHGKEVLPQDEMDAIKGQVFAVHDNPAFTDFLGAKTEQAVFLECPETGLILKALLDLEDDWGFLDWKSTRKKTRKGFWRDFENYGYGKQISHYRHTSGRESHFIGTVTNEAPYRSQLYEIEWDDIHADHEENMLQLKELAGLLRMHRPDDETDSQGVPLVFLGDGWGACVPSSECRGGMPQFAGAEVVEVPYG